LERDLGEYIRANLGEDTLEVADTIAARELTDEEISKITGFRINDVRSSLYRLYDSRLAFYRRSRDPKTGWFVYHWRMDADSRSRVLEGQRKKELDVLKKRVSYEEENIFFVCKAGNCSRFTFEIAADNGFKCPNCGSMLEHHDNSGIVSSLRARIERLEAGLDGEEVE
jgi:transcription initiation factor TFIIE subunit alpha